MSDISWRAPPVKVGDRLKGVPLVRGSQGDPIFKIGGYVVIVKNVPDDESGMICVVIKTVKYTFAIAEYDGR